MESFDMTKEREALKLALEYIETNAHERRHVRWAIKAALAQPVQVTSGWSLRYVYFDENGIPLMHREPEERNFCPRCGKRTADLTTIHTCTPPDDNALQRSLARTKEVVAGSQAFYGFPHGPVSTPNAGGKCVTAGETAPKEST
jgi:hypothetical protein